MCECRESEEREGTERGREIRWKMKKDKKQERQRKSKQREN